MSDDGANILNDGSANAVPSAGQTCRHLAQALIRHVDHSSAVAGAPSTHIGALLAEHDPARFEWAVDEKTAMEAAVGLSAAGLRSALVFKHNGLNIALDSLMNAAVHSIGAAVVLVCGDDPEANGSTSVQDSRLLAEAAGVPVLEPTLLGDTDEVLARAVELSELAGVPVLVRITPALHRDCGTRGASMLDPSSRAQSRPSAPRLDADVAHGLTKFGRHQRRGLITEPAVRSFVDRAGLVHGRCAEDCRVAVIAVGSAALAAQELNCCVLAVGATAPLPAEVVSWADAHERVIVAEEPDPVAEQWLAARMAGPDRLRGRRSGHLPLCGSVTPADLSKVIETDQTGSWPDIERKSAAVPPLSPYDRIFDAVAGLHRDGAFVATDVGSSVRLCYPPYEAADVALSLGSAIAVAGGAARAGRRSIAVIGDYAVLHSGLGALVSAAEHGLPLLSVVLVNGVQAKTGGQPLPPVDLAALVRACGIAVCEGWHVEDAEEQGAERIRALLDGPLPAVALVDSRVRP
jgi:indolepyruvate ferredoxin oxidoreductase alpha subunit